MRRNEYDLQPGLSVSSIPGAFVVLETTCNGVPCLVLTSTNTRETREDQDKHERVLIPGRRVGSFRPLKNSLLTVSMGKIETNGSVQEDILAAITRELTEEFGQYGKDIINSIVSLRLRPDSILVEQVGGKLAQPTVISGQAVLGKMDWEKIAQVQYELDLKVWSVNTVLEKLEKDMDQFRPAAVLALLWYFGYTNHDTQSILNKIRTTFS